MKDQDKKEHLAFMAKQWRLNNPEKAKAQALRSREKNKEKIKTKAKAYYQENRNSKMLKQKKYYADNKEAVKKYQRELRRRRPEIALFKHAKCRAKLKDIEFSISANDIIFTKLCPLLEIPIYIGDGKLCDNSPTLDRIDNTKGYIPGNIQVLSYKANRMKSNSSFKELEKLYFNWKEQEKNNDSI